MESKNIHLIPIAPAEAQLADAGRIAPAAALLAAREAVRPS